MQMCTSAKKTGISRIRLALVALPFPKLFAMFTSFAGAGFLIAGLQGTTLGSNEPVMTLAVGVVIITLGLWMTGVAPEFFTSLLFLCLSVILMIAPPERVFAGFHTSAMWLIFGGLVIGYAVTNSGLGDRFVRRILELAPNSYLGILTTVALSGVAISFIIPTAIGRVILLAPIAVRLASRLGFGEGSKGRTGIVLTAGMSTTLPAFTILPSNVPNLVMSAMAESAYDVTLTYGRYLLLNFPVLGSLSLAITILLNWRFFGEEPNSIRKPRELSPASVAELKMSVVLGVTVLLWATDFVHGVSPAWIAMGAALVCIAPRIGVVPTTDLVKRINFAPMFFVAGVVGFGAIVSDVGVSEYAGGYLVSLFNDAPLEHDIIVYGSLILVGSIVSLGTTVPTAPGVMTPLAGQLAEATGWSLESVLMAQVPTWVMIPLPYLVPPLLLTLSIGQIHSREAVRVLASYFAIGVFLSVPLHFMWGRALGYF